MYLHASFADARRQTVKNGMGDGKFPSRPGALDRIIPKVTPRSPLDATSTESGPHDTGDPPGDPAPTD